MAPVSLLASISETSGRDEVASRRLSASRSITPAGFTGTEATSLVTDVKLEPTDVRKSYLLAKTIVGIVDVMDR